MSGGKKADRHNRSGRSQHTGRSLDRNHTDRNHTDRNHTDRNHTDRNEQILETPVWQEEGLDMHHDSYLEDGEKRLNEKSRQRIASARKVHEVQVTADEAFRLIEAGVAAESEGRYSRAVKLFAEAGEMLVKVRDKEESKRVQYYMHAKSDEVLTWAENLIEWMEQRGNYPNTGPPARMGRTVATSVAGILDGKVKELKRDDPHEVTHMYYTACSSKRVEHFSADGYRLQCIENGRRPQMMIVITMYNEDASELESTLRKVANNMKHVTAQQLPGYAGDDAWKNMLVVIVSDGRTKANNGTLEFLSNIGCYNFDCMNIHRRGIDVNCHIFEYTTRLVNHKGAKKFLGKSGKPEVYPPMQLVFALKEHNAGKLNSHEWYFNAFAEHIRPEYTVLLDVGTLPTKTAFYRLLTAMEINPQIGGTCGEIAVDRPIPHLCNTVIAAQHFEYKISNILDKSLESVFGFISVLPGAFSAYRYAAIRGAPLKAYFKSLTTPVNELGPFQGNMYLAEDRILCFELLAKKGKRWTMHYVKDAIARTDVPTDLVSLIGQRRRWLNGSFFALVYTIMNWGRVYSESSHSYLRKLFFFFQYTYMTANVVLSWFLLANFFLVTFFFVIVGLRHDNWGFIPTKGLSSGTKDTMIQAFLVVYGVAFLIQVVGGLGNKPKHIKRVYLLASIFYGLVMILTSIIAVGFIALPHLEGNAAPFGVPEAIAAAATVGVFFIASAIHGEIHHIIMSFMQYMSLLPTFINVLNTYSFCNLHDLSWGTKGLESAEGHGPPKAAGSGNYKDAVKAQERMEALKKKEAQIKDQTEADFQYFRSKFLLLWLVSNLAFGYGVIKWDGNGGPDSGKQYLSILFYFVAAFNLIRLFGSILFLLYHYRQSLFIVCGIKHKMNRRLKKRQKMHRRYEQQQLEQEAMQENYHPV